ncbi:hypothetical protein [Plastoroseomonas hellenica]|uniref:hypothetical protein n=1 Tax=Plastoroseomonas hellenica TaxID=2687306 RepID=UPI001BA81FA6|nr:hypothetical protein [Plastoroseomonas hellenica]MBR0645020.1 hypothetical protein [Plastoroseomonas hellenica]
MKPFLIAAVLAASTLGVAGTAMAAFVGEDARTRGTSTSSTTMLGGNSDESFIKRQNQQYNTDPGE